MIKRKNKLEQIVTLEMNVELYHLPFGIYENHKS